MDCCEHAALKCSLKWSGPPVLSSSVIGWKPPDKQANGGWTVKEGAAWLEPRSRWGPTGVLPGSCWDRSVWRRFRRRRCLTRRFTSCGLSFDCCCSLFSPLVWTWISVCPWTRKLALCSAELLQNSRCCSGWKHNVSRWPLIKWFCCWSLKKNFRRTFPGPGFCRDCLERFFQNKWRDD